MRRNFVVIHSDVLEAAYEEGMDAVSFIIGHELGHIQRNHVGFFKSLLIWPASWIPLLGLAYSRSCEYTCDNIGYHLCPDGAINGILILALGKKLYKKVVTRELMSTFEKESGFAVSFDEIFSTHPALIKRIAVINQLNYSNSIKENPAFISPKIDINNKETWQ